ncbi:MAG: nuclear transport factor 2 family protein [Myxococcota bacterium]
MSETNLETAQAFYTRIASGDMEAFMATLADDIEAIAPGSRRHIPWAGTWRGKEGFGEMMTTLSENVDIEAYTPLRFVVDGSEGVLVVGHERLRTRETQRVVESAWVHEITVRDGVVTRFVEHYDTDSLALALAG